MKSLVRTAPAALTFAVFLIAAGAAMRILRDAGFVHLPPNFAPVSAMAMFSAVYLPHRLAFVIPVALMLVSDAVIGFDLWPITVSIYACFAVSTLLGWWLGRGLTVARLIGASLLGSIVFYLVTNAAVWLSTSMYSKDLSGLMASYIAGLPFLRNTALGDLMYTGLMFGLYQVVMVYLQFKAPVAKRTA